MMPKKPPLPLYPDLSTLPPAPPGHVRRKNDGAVIPRPMGRPKGIKETSPRRTKYNVGKVLPKRVVFASLAEAKEWWIKRAYELAQSEDEKVAVIMVRDVLKRLEPIPEGKGKQGGEIVIRFDPVLRKPW